MALVAGYCQVRPRQRKLGLTVIEDRGLPGGGGVARLTIGRKARCHVIRIRCSIEIRPVATDAGHQSTGIDAIDMTGRTRCRHMRAG